MCSLRCGEFWGERKPEPVTLSGEELKGKLSVRIWECGNKPFFFLREREGAKCAIPQIFPGLESPVP